METVTVWSAAPPGACVLAVRASVRIAQRSLLANKIPTTLDLAATPEQDPSEPPLIRGVVTGSRHAAIVVIDQEAGDLDPACTKLIDRVRSMQQRRRTVNINLYINSAIASTAHNDLAKNLPGDVGLPAWPTTSYTHALELLEILAVDLIVGCTERWPEVNGGRQ